MAVKKKAAKKKAVKKKAVKKKAVKKKAAKKRTPRKGPSIKKVLPDIELIARILLDMRKTLGEGLRHRMLSSDVELRFMILFSSCVLSMMAVGEDPRDWFKEGIADVITAKKCFRLAGRMAASIPTETDLTWDLLEECLSRAKTEACSREFEISGRWCRHLPGR